MPYELSYLVEFKLLSVERTGKVMGSKVMMSANFEQKVKKGIFYSWRKNSYFSLLNSG